MAIALKICGVTRADDAQLVADLGIDYIGYNFFAGSPRYLSPAAACRLHSNLKSGQRGLPVPVAVMVKPTQDEVASAVSDFPEIAVLQVHGLKDARRQLGAGPERQLWEAHQVAQPADLPQQVHPGIDLLLLDHRASGANAGLFGGTGQRFDWSWLQSWQAPIPWGLAGGLRSEIIPEVSKLRCKPMLLDVCSGVESSPGIKDAAAVRLMVAAVARLNAERR